MDNWRTPHTKDMHVVERFRLIDGGRGLEAKMPGLALLTRSFGKGPLKDCDTFTVPQRGASSRSYLPERKNGLLQEPCQCHVTTRSD